MAGKDKENKSTGNIVSQIVNHIKASKKKKMNVKLSGNKLAQREVRQFQNSLQGMTKEEKIAANKARVAKYHPEPDFSNVSPSLQIAKERQKIKHERDMLEKAKKIWHSIVSVPMGGTNKKH